MTFITGVHMAGGTQHEHIASVWWLQSDGKSNTLTTQGMVDFIEKGNAVQVGGPNGPIAVGVVRVQGRSPYLRTVADGQPKDNLLSLPRF